jgi:hypothetical protein
VFRPYQRNQQKGFPCFQVGSCNYSVCTVRGEIQWLFHFPTFIGPSSSAALDGDIGDPIQSTLSENKGKGQKTGQVVVGFVQVDRCVPDNGLNIPSDERVPAGVTGITDSIRDFINNNNLSECDLYFA